MNSVRLIILGVALLAGMACVALLARGMAGAHPHQVVVVAAPPPPAPTARVLTAKHDLAVGDLIGEADIQWQDWPATALNPAYITDGPVKKAEAPGLAGTADKLAEAAKKTMATPASGAGAVVLGAIVRQPILAGEPIIAAKVVHAGGAGIMAVTLDRGMRAMALPLSAESAAGGFILPGDHVDVVLTRQMDSAAGLNGATNKTFLANTVLNNVKVLAIDQNTGVQKGASVIGATGTVEVTEKQAETLLLAKSSGQLTFVLRSYADAQGPATAGDMAGHANPDAGVVHVFRNGASTPVMVTR